MKEKVKVVVCEECGKVLDIGEANGPYWCECKTQFVSRREKNLGKEEIGTRIKIGSVMGKYYGNVILRGELKLKALVERNFGKNYEAVDIKDVKFVGEDFEEVKK